MALITAGGLLLRLEGKDKLLKEATVKVEEEYEKDAVKGDPAPKGTPTVKTFKAEAKELFDQARIDGAGLPELEKLIKLAHEQKYVLKLPDYLERGSAIGPQVINRHIAGGATHPFKIPFFAGQPATFGFRYTGPCHVSVVRSDVDHYRGQRRDHGWQRQLDTARPARSSSGLYHPHPQHESGASELPVLHKLTIA